jgi:hypothetical protein
MKLNFCILSIICAIVILAINQTVNAQSDNFKPYTNNDMKFSIQYPSNWRIEEDEKSPHETVFFRTSNRTDFAVNIKKVEPYLDTDTMTVKNTSLRQNVEKFQENFSSLFIDPKLIRQNNITIGGNDAVKVEYMAGDQYVSWILTIANGKLYTLGYNAEALKVPETLPLANKMVESFQIKE